MKKILTTPIKAEDLQDIRVGDVIYLTGTLVILDPSRLILRTSAWAKGDDIEDQAKIHIRPYDAKVYWSGWYDYHRAGGPAVWNEGLTVASVCPARSSTPFFLAASGNMWPGRRKSSGRDRAFTHCLAVTPRSAAEMPVEVLMWSDDSHHPCLGNQA